ncbi:uncharacterized protein [Apostichopus japonicus]|uniref:uncharacterized protein isoform X2 n=1 Tax=Stichopus japonicus TaxID=307972 RepID=UPI003AB5E018
MFHYHRRLSLLLAVATLSSCNFRWGLGTEMPTQESSTEEPPTVEVTVDRTAPMCENVPVGPFGVVEVGMAAGTQVSWEEPTCNDISQTATVTDRTFLPGSFFLVGQTEVIYTCTDASGNSEMCVFSVTVFEVDTTPPECTNLPNDIRQIVELGTAGTEVFWIEPTCFDLSGTGRISMQSATSPFFFSVGMMLVTYTCTDASSNQNTCSFTVTIDTIDTVSPIISLCPVEQTIQVELGVTSAVAFWVEPTATDVSGTAMLLSRSIGPGESVPLGTTIVNYIFTDASSNTATCTFSITVSPVDTTPPVVVCTDDVPLEVELGTTGTIAVWTGPTATDISGVTSLTERSQSPGSFFSVGKTTVTYVFSDNTGNSATCIFCVCITTVDTTPPTCANVPQGVLEIVELGVTGTLVDWVELTCEDQSRTAFVTERTHNPSSFFEVGMTTVTYTCTDTSGNSQLCPFLVTVITEDTTDPTCVNLPTGVVEFVELGVPGAIVNWEEPTCDDLSGTATVTMRSNAPFSFFSVGMTVVTYTCTDQAMNSGMCSFTVTITAVDRTAPMCENVPVGPVGLVEFGMAFGTQVSWEEPTCNDISQTATVTDRTVLPGSFFLVGQTEVKYTCTDASGNSEMCVFSVTVFEVDTTPPECTNLPNDIRQIVELGTAGTEVSWIEPTCFDLSGTGRISMQSATSPFFFSVGMMLVTYTCTDASSNQNTCSFTVTIDTIDTVSPIISLCPVEQTIQVELGVTSAVAFWVEPTATDVSGTAMLLSRSIGPGESVPLGTTIVNYIFTDASSNTATCTFSITVSPVDTTPPVVVCTDDVPLEVELGTTGTIAVWTGPTATDISGVTSLTERSQSPGSFFSVGKTTVTYVFSDNTGNSATCIFCVCITTVDTTPPTCANVPQGVLEVVELGVTGTLVDWVELTCEDQSRTAFVTERTHNPSSFFEVGMTTVTYTCTDTSGNSQLCPFLVTVITEDTTDPTCVNLPTGVVEFVELGVPGAIVNWEEPTCDDLSGTATVTMRSNAPFSFFSVGMTVVTYTCTDQAMNSGMCSFTVTITAVDRTAPMCENVPVGPVGLVEFGMAFGTQVSWEEPTCNDISQTATVTDRTVLPGSFFLVGQTEVKYTCTDASGNSEMCVFSVTVFEVDTTPPECTNLPNDIRQIVELGTAGTEVSWIEPTCFDLSGTGRISMQSATSPFFFSVGMMLVTYTCTDASSNQNTCSFTVTIDTIDTVSPIISLCPVEQTIQVELGVTSAVAFWVEPTATDVSGTAMLLSRSIGPGESVPLGTTIVNYIFTDASSNTATCTFSITVSPVDTTPPVVVCTDDVPLEVELGTTGTIAVWTGPTATDISGVTSLTERSQSPGSFFSVGKTTVTYVFSDNTGNSATCIFCVCITTVDTTPPTCANVPQGVLEVVELGVTGTLVDWVELTCEDQSRTAFVTERTHNPSSFFEVGMTTVTYTCTDTSGNSQLCPFLVTVITEDTTDPTCVNLPTGVVEFVELGVPGAIVNWEEPTCDDLSGTATVTMRSNAPFSFFSVGMTVVTYTCTDQAMNSGMCSFTVTVTAVNRTAPMCENVPMGPIGQVEVGMAAGTQVSWEEPTCNDISQTATVTDRTFLPGSFFLVGQTEVIYTCTDASGNSEMCVFSVTVFEVDTTPPECTNLPNDIRQIVELGTAGTEVFWIEPTCFDLSGTGRISMQSATSPFFFSVGMMLVTYTCTDASSNQNTCSFTVTIDTIDTVSPIISLCPVEQTIQVELGVTSAVAFWVEPTATDVSGTAMLLSRSIGPGESVPLGTTIVNYIFSDASSNTATCTFSITVSPVDRMAPMCENVPMGPVGQVEVGMAAGTQVSWEEPTCNDISQTATVTDRTFLPGSFFLVGQTEVIYTCTDASGNSEMCVFSVTVFEVDTTPPECTNLPNDIRQIVELGTAGTEVSWIEPTCFDLSGTGRISMQSATSPFFFSVGMMLVTYTCTDASSNQNTCSFTVTIDAIDAKPPMEETTTDSTSAVVLELDDILRTLAEGNIITEEVEMDAESIETISNDQEVLEKDPEVLGLVILTLEAVTGAGEASVNITEPVVRIINNLMDLDQDTFEDKMVGGERAVAALEEQVTNFQSSEGNFSTVLDNVGVTAVKINRETIGSSLAFANVFQEHETPVIGGALQEGNTRLFSDGNELPLERTVTSISVPSTVLDLLGEAGVELTAVPVSFILYGNDVLFRPSMPTNLEENKDEGDNSTVTERVASQIISAILRLADTSIENLPPGSPAVVTTFKTILTITEQEAIEAQDCVVWDYDEKTGEGFWTKDGCERISDDNSAQTTCSCNKLGSFAILIRVRKGSFEAQIALQFITLIGSIISGLALIACLVTFVSLKSFRSKQPTHIHINLCLSLLGFYIAILVNPLAVGKEVRCTVASVFVHFFTLATSAWMSAEAMNMYYLFLKADRSTVRHFIPIACLLAYGLSALCALLVVLLDKTTNFQTSDYCFIHPGYAYYFGFLMEIVAMFVFNFVIFILVIRKILCRPLMVSRTIDNAKRNEIIKRVRHAVLFWFVLGLSWLFGFLAAVDTKTLIFDYLYCFFISIQGILMFFLLCVANPEFRRKFKRVESTRSTTQSSRPTTSKSRKPDRQSIHMDQLNPSYGATSSGSQSSVYASTLNQSEAGAAGNDSESVHDTPMNESSSAATADDSKTVYDTPTNNSTVQ